MKIKKHKRNQLKLKNEKIQKELHIARQIQERLIPKDYPLSTIFALYKPMAQVGGDFFDFFKMKETGEIGIFLFGEKMKEWFDRFAFDADFGKHGKFDLIIQRTKFLDFLIGTRFLLAEFIGGKAQHHQSLFFIFRVQLHQFLILGSKTAFGSGIDDQKDFPFIILEFYRFSLDIVLGEIINALNGFRGVDSDGWTEYKEEQDEDGQNHKITHVRSPSGINGFSFVDCVKVDEMKNLVIG
mgnify:CR=1 FL=1